MKRIAETLGVARSNLVERVDGKRPKRGPQIRAGDVELTSHIRRLVDARPSYGYRRIGAHRAAVDREDYNSEHPHSRLGYRSPREYIASLKPAECPV
ncbi:transposase InsO family protein [Bradyrhizobium sp. USDA 4486]